MPRGNKEIRQKNLMRSQNYKRMSVSYEAYIRYLNRKGLGDFANPPKEDTPEHNSRAGHMNQSKSGSGTIIRVSKVKP